MIYPVCRQKRTSFPFLRYSATAFRDRDILSDETSRDWSRRRTQDQAIGNNRNGLAEVNAKARQEAITDHWMETKSILASWSGPVACPSSAEALTIEKGSELFVCLFVCLCVCLFICWFVCSICCMLTWVPVFFSCSHTIIHTET